MTFSNEAADASGLFSVDSSGEIRSESKEVTKKPDENEAEIAKTETKAVTCLRLLVIFVLVASAVIVSLGIYFYIKGAEEDTFQQRFDDDSTKILESVGSTLDDLFGTVDEFVVSLTSYAKSSDSTWPFVVVPNFAVRASKLRSLTKTFMVGMHLLVTEDIRSGWEWFSASNNGWVEDGMRVQDEDPNYYGNITVLFPQQYSTITDRDTDSPLVFYARSEGPWLPQWQTSPTNDMLSYNFNILSEPTIKAVYEAAMANPHNVFIGDVINYIADPNDETQVIQVQTRNNRFSVYARPGQDPSEPVSRVIYPMLDNIDEVDMVDNGSRASTVGFFFLNFYWRHFLANILPPGEEGVVCVIENACNQSFTYQVTGPMTDYLGQGDLHDSGFDSFEVSSKFTELAAYSIQKRTYSGLPLDDSYCPYSLRVYPSKAFEDEYITNQPLVFSLSAMMIFVFTSAVFVLYDFLVERRQKKTMKTAVDSSAVVSSLFPSTVRDRLFPQEEPSDEKKKKKKGAADTFLAGQNGNQNKLKSLMGRSTNQSQGEEGDNNDRTKSLPIADLYPEASVYYGDIAGFTAWSSAREPEAVFILLQHIFDEFDKAAKFRGVFKVETIGDCYLAVTGVPEPRKDHATALCRFAKDCRNAFNRKMKELAQELGPGTTDLKWRSGIHSGPVTAGVLRGDKARFQLFGATVETAARMESSGMPNRIQVSQGTADALTSAGKGHWLAERPERMKGLPQTYWMEPRTGTASVTSGTSMDDSPSIAADALGTEEGHNSEDTSRCVEWISDVLVKMLQGIISHRRAVGDCETQEGGVSKGSPQTPTARQEGATIVEEVAEVVPMAVCDVQVARKAKAAAPSIKLDMAVLSQLHNYVSTIGKMHPENAFHSLSHAAWVAQSVVKFISQIDGASDNEERDPSFGIASDPLALFACVFSALIHNVCHKGVPNKQLAKDSRELVGVYTEKSVSEQLSFDVAWELLLQDQFSEFRAALCTSEADMWRFRQLVINMVVATDLEDAGMRASREARWEKAFREVTPLGGEIDKDLRNLRATLVLEYLIQASAVSHCMQYWELYRKWSERMFRECYKAFLDGRGGDVDPCETWYQGELGFFDYCILPLAHKLKDCGVLGGSSDEYLSYATKNSQEWMECGREIMKEFAESAKKP